jgi:predicted nucleic acid-binding protein
VLATVDVRTYDLVIARTHGRLSAHLAGAGTPVGAHDLIIASTAVALDWTVVTRDERSFKKIPGLAVAIW